MSEAMRYLKMNKQAIHDYNIKENPKSPPEPFVPNMQEQIFLDLEKQIEEMKIFRDMSENYSH